MKYECITIPSAELFDDVMWRAVTVDLGGPLGKLIRQYQDNATPENLQRAYDEAARSIGATSAAVTIYSERPLQMKIVAHFPESMQAWETARDIHNAELEGLTGPPMGATPDNMYWRSAWRHISDRCSKKLGNYEELPPGTWQIGGVGRNLYKDNPDYLMFKAIADRRKWQEQLSTAYDLAIGRKEGEFNTNRLALLDVPCRNKTTILKLPLVTDEETNQTRLFLPTGCRLLPRREMYRYSIT